MSDLQTWENEAPSSPEDTDNEGHDEDSLSGDSGASLDAHTPITGDSAALPPPTRRPRIPHQRVASVPNPVTVIDEPLEELGEQDHPLKF